MKFKMFITVVFLLSFLLSCGGKGGSGSHSDDPDNPIQRIKKVLASSGGSKSFPLRVSMKAMAAAKIDLSNTGEYVATYNDIEGSADKGKIIRIDKKDSSGNTVEYYEYTYTTYDSGTKNLTIKLWKNSSGTVVGTTKFFYDSAATTSVEKFIDVVEYVGTTDADANRTSYVRYRYDLVNSAWRLEQIQQYATYNPIEGDQPFNNSIYTYYDGTNDLYCIQYDIRDVNVASYIGRWTGVDDDASCGVSPVTTYKYYTQPVVVSDVEIITEIETTVGIGNVGSDADVTSVNNYITDEDGLLVTVEENTGEAVDIPVIDVGGEETGEADTSPTGTEPIIIDYDYVYETGDSTDSNWFNTFYKEFYPFSE